MGHYLDFSNSLHIYGENIGEVKEMFTRMKNRGEPFPEEIVDLIENDKTI